MDALVTIYGAVQLSRPNALIQIAHALIGSLVCDASAVARIAEATCRSDESTWRAAVVAMGLLGTSPLGLPRPASDDT